MGSLVSAKCDKWAAKRPYQEYTPVNKLFSIYINIPLLIYIIHT